MQVHTHYTIDTDATPGNIELINSDAWLVNKVKIAYHIEITTKNGEFFFAEPKVDACNVEYELVTQPRVPLFKNDFKVLVCCVEPIAHNTPYAPMVADIDFINKIIKLYF